MRPPPRPVCAARARSGADGDAIRPPEPDAARNRVYIGGARARRGEGHEMGVPTGEIVARPMVTRACGCLREFQHYAVDRYRTQRLAKFQSTRCEDCVAKL